MSDNFNGTVLETSPRERERGGGRGPLNSFGDISHSNSLLSLILLEQSLILLDLFFMRFM